MSLATGTRVGSYTILATIGAGGMGEVYRARDTRLDRDVALKILPEIFASDPDRLARFEREAKTLASLNHPHIAHIYGFEQSGTTSALVMELVEGEDLAQRLARGAIPLDEVLPIAQQIAEALEAAHEQGIIHRDLKPANIKLRPDGTVKVLDFGLAKALARDEPPRDISQSPTVTVDGTQAGVILGTAAYMSPEQTRGRAIDKRTDIWAFGCVLYEMLTGRAAFARDTVSDTIARILERDPDWSLLPAATPARIRRVLRRCLEKDARHRLRDIGDAWLELQADRESTAPAPATARRWTSWLAIAALVALSAALAAVGALSLRETPGRNNPTRFTFGAPAGETLEVLAAAVPSPDGRRIAFVMRQPSGRRAIWIRPIDSTVVQRIDGTEGVTGAPFWSPDGRFLGFIADGRLKKIDPSGGPALTICPSPNNLGATWSRDNVIVFAPLNRTSLYRVSAAGGASQAMTVLNEQRRENSHRHPFFLPDGRHFLFTARSDVKENNLIYVGSLDAPGVTPLLAAQSNAVYAPPGYLLFAREGVLMAQRFDVRNLSLSGEAFPIATPIHHITPSSHALFVASANGRVLTYLPEFARGTRLTWFNRAGDRQGSIGPEGEFGELRIAPSGKTASVVIADADSGNRDIWLIDLTTGSLTRLTTNPANDWQVAWAPDSRHIAFASDRNGRSSVYRKAVDGGDEELVLQLPDRGAFSKDWSADGRFLALNVDTPDGLPQIWAMALDGNRKPFSLNTSTFRENEPTISPDVQWVAYESDESGATEIYVKRFAGSAKTRLSTSGGMLPRWRRDGRELFYRTPGGDVMSVALNPGTTLEASAPVRLFTGCQATPLGIPPPDGRSVSRYDVAGDGKRFLMTCAGASPIPMSITVSIDWTAALNP